MYSRDVPLIKSHALGSDDGLLDAATFVLCSIRQPLYKIHKQMADIDEKGEDSVYLFSFKRKGFIYVRDNATVLRNAMLEITDEVEAVKYLTQVPGLHVVKASFLAQCLGFNVACLDTHNLKQLNLKHDAFKCTPKQLDATVRHYVDITQSTGGSEYWWNRWCNYVAGRRGSPLKTAGDVSSYHYEAIAGVI
jgi:hypothetical protein